MTRSEVFLTKFEVFVYSRRNTVSSVDIHVSSGVNGEVKSSKSMLIRTGYPNLLHGCDFLCSNLMNCYEFEKSFYVCI